MSLAHACILPSAGLPLDTLKPCFQVSRMHKPLTTSNLQAIFLAVSWILCKNHLFQREVLQSLSLTFTSPECMVQMPLSSLMSSIPSIRLQYRGFSCMTSISIGAAFLSSVWILISLYIFSYHSYLYILLWPQPTPFYAQYGMWASRDLDSRAQYSVNVDWW